MSADNFVLIRKKSDGFYYWGNFSMSYDSGEDIKHEDNRFKYGPFATSAKAIQDAEEKLTYIEYGIGVEK